MMKFTPQDKKVEDWKHEKSGCETIIYLSGTDFVANLLAEWFSAPDIGTLRKKLRARAEVHYSMEWFPVMEVTIEESGRSHSYRDSGAEGEAVSFKSERYWLGMSNAGEIFRCDWEVDESHRKAQMETIGGGYSRRGSGKETKALKLVKLPLTAPLKQSDGNYVIAYDEAVWDKGEQIIEGIHALRQQIKTLFQTKAGIEKLLTGGGDGLLLKR